MIFIDRKKIEAPVSLISKNSKGKIERKKAINYYSKGKTKRNFNFTAYKLPEVKEALIKLFNGKCAYCESFILHVYSGDVEHFRPKSQIKYPKEDNIKTIKPGYYWLAADWDNLFLACKNCNSPSTQLLSDGYKKVVGKWDYFPLSDSSKHLKSHLSKFAKEESYRLLVNPCIDKPENLFQFDEMQGTIKPLSSNAFEILMAEKSIDIYGLDRMHLVHERKKVIIDCFVQIRRINDALEIFDNATSQRQKAKYTIILQREVDLLKSYCHPKAPYSAVAKQIYRRYFKQFIYDLRRVL